MINFDDVTRENIKGKLATNSWSFIMNINSKTNHYLIW